MSKFLKINYKAIENLRAKLDKCSKTERQKICRDSAIELGAILERKTKNRTPVGQYPKSSGKIGGTLKRNWQTTCETLPNGYEVTVYNPVEYAEYVEYGHRTRNNKSWVPGRYMLTSSTTEVNNKIEAVVAKHIRKVLGGIFKDDK